MGYSIGQYNEISRGVDFEYLSAASSGIAGRVDVETAVSLKDDENIIFKEEYVKPNIIMEQDKNYYFHALIKAEADDEKIFDIYLTNIDKSSEEENLQRQFLRTIKVNNGNGNYIDCNIVFSPVLNYNAILFKLRRTGKDFDSQTVSSDNTYGRTTVIYYMELSEINNTMFGSEYIKCGIQSRPGQFICINNSDILVGRTGTYELKSGDVTINFIGFVFPQEKGIPSTSDKSQCFFTEDGERTIDNFIVDYISYDNEKGGKV